MNQLFKWLGSLDPLYFLLAYLACVPAFALIYYTLPGGFYAPYAKLERSALGDSNFIAGLVSKTIDRHLQSVNDKRVAANEPYAVDGWAIAPRAVTIARLLPNSDENHLQVQLTIFFSDNSETSMGIPVEATLVAFRSNSVGSNLAEIIPHLWSLDQPFRSIVQQLAFPTPLVDVAREDVTVLLSYLDGLQGDPLGITDSYFRMLYFSIVVITTVGFGDIVPMTTAARAWVSLEAILGIVLAGLFINSIAKRD